MARLTARIRIDSLRRIVEGRGGHASILARGDAHSGALIAVICDRGTPVGLLEAFTDQGGAQRWRSIPLPEADENQEKIEEESAAPIRGRVGSLARFIDRRRRSDPDLWVLELDIANGQRFADEMIHFD